MAGVRGWVEAEDRVVHAKQVAVGHTCTRAALAQAAPGELLEADELLLDSPDPLQAEPDLTSSGRFRN